MYKLIRENRQNNKITRVKREDNKGSAKKDFKKSKKVLDKRETRGYHKEVGCSGSQGHRKENRDIP